MPPSKKISEEKELTKAIAQLDVHMKKLADHYEPGKYLWMGFFRGIVYGLGILVAISLIVPIIIAILSSIDWIPVIGDTVADIVERIQSAQRPY
jgi:hypothetical protein